MIQNPIAPVGYVSPLGKASLFYLYFDNPDPLPQEENYNYKIVYCDSGVEVFDLYNQNQEKPTPKQIIIYIEKPSSSNSNFFGTACRVRMGDSRRQFMQSLQKKKANVAVKEAPFEASTLSQWASNISYVNRDVNTDALTNAVLLELMSPTEFNDIMRNVFSVNKTLADWINKGVEAIEKYKFTEKNYDYGKHFLKPNYDYLNRFSSNKPDFDPLLPIPTFNYHGGLDGKSLSVDKAFKQLTTLHNYFDELSLGVVAGVVKTTPTIADDAFLAVIYVLKNLFESNLDELTGVKSILFKLKEFIALAYENCKKLVTKLAEHTQEAIALLNAFLCGLLNGLISIIQAILSIVAFAVEYLPALDLKQLSPDKISIVQEKLEFAEDLVDIISQNTKPFFDGIITTLTDAKTYTEMITFVKVLWRKGLTKVSNYNEYDWAYILGAIGFEVVLDLIIAFFTGGTSLVAQTMAKISRVATKFKGVAVKTGKTIGYQVAKNVKSLFALLKKEFEEFVEALQNGNIVNWLKKKLANLVGEVVEELVEYGISELSQFAIEHRKTLPNPNHNGNIAVFEYYDNEGKLVKKAFTTEIDLDEHAEEIGLDWFKKEGIPFENVKTIYSELEPCSLNGHGCKEIIKNNFIKANTEYSFPYPGLDSDRNAVNIRRKSIKDRIKLLKNLL